MKSRVETMDHVISIIADVNKYELEDVKPDKIMVRQKAWKPYFEWRDAKENAGKLTWTLALYGTGMML